MNGRDLRLLSHTESVEQKKTKSREYVANVWKIGK